jgi:hypothetical protein
MENHHFLLVNQLNGPFSIAMLVYQRVEKTSSKIHESPISLENHLPGKCAAETAGSQQITWGLITG